jgi:heme oxygenase
MTGPDLAARRRVPALREDLADDLADPAPAPLAVPDDVAGSLGVLYVLEGSTLGARSLLPRLRRAGTIPGRVGHRYLEGYGDATAIRWHAFCAALERLDSAAAERAEHCAQRTFTDILDWRKSWDAVS